MAVVAITTFGNPAFRVVVGCCWAKFVDISAKLISAPVPPALREGSPFQKWTDL